MVEHVEQSKQFNTPRIVDVYVYGKRTSSRPRSAYCNQHRFAATMSTPKKVKMSDEPVPAEPDAQAFQALDQVQQKLDQVCMCVCITLQRKSGCAMSIDVLCAHS